MKEIENMLFQMVPLIFAPSTELVIPNVAIDFCVLNKTHPLKTVL